jgi:hypothetical protein
MRKHRWPALILRLSYKKPANAWQKHAENPRLKVEMTIQLADG